MRLASPRRVLRIIGVCIVTAVGAAIGALVGVIASFAIWHVVWDDTGSDHPSIAALLFVAFFVVPIATVAGVALALTLVRRGGRPAQGWHETIPTDPQAQEDRSR